MKKSLFEYYEIKPDLNRVKNITKGQRSDLEEIFNKEVTLRTADRYKKYFILYLSDFVDPFRQFIPTNVSIIEDLMRGSNEDIEDRLRFVSALEPGLNEGCTVIEVRKMLKLYKPLKAKINKLDEEKAIHQIIKNQQAQLLETQNYIEHLSIKLLENESFVNRLLSNDFFIEGILKNKKFMAGIKALLETKK